MKNDLEKQIDELISKVEPIPEPEPEPKPESTPVPPVVEPQPKPDETPSKVEEPVLPKVEEPAPEPTPIKIEPIIEVEETLEEVRGRNDLLLQRIEELTAQLVTGTPIPSPVPIGEVKKEVVPEPTPKPDVAPSTEKPIKVGESIDFIGEIDVDDLIDDKSKFNDLLNKVFAAGIAASQEIVKGKVLDQLPILINQQTTNKMAAEKFLGDFYSANPELTNVKMTVEHVVKQVHVEKPDLKPVEAFNEAADRTRKMLGIKKVVKSNKQDFDDPAFVSKGGGGKGPLSRVKSGDQQSQINELLTH